MEKGKFGFTLVGLIVVIVILATLGTIAFIFFDKNDMDGLIVGSDNQPLVNGEVVSERDSSNDIILGDYTIMDRNLGATSAYNGETESTSVSTRVETWRGNYYQFGRDTTDWTNGSSSYSYDWKSPGGTDAGSANDWGVANADSLTATYANSTSVNQVKMQGPCPIGYHVPTTLEWDGLVKAWFTSKGVSCTATSAGSYCSLSGDASFVNFKSDLKLSVSGWRDRYDGSVRLQGSYGFYWSSSPNGEYAHTLYFYSSYVFPQDLKSRAFGFSVRCFKDY